MLQPAKRWGDTHWGTSEEDCWQKKKKKKRHSSSETLAKVSKFLDEFAPATTYPSLILHGCPSVSNLWPTVTAQHQPTIIPIRQWATELTTCRGWSSWPNNAILEQAIVGMTKDTERVMVQQQLEFIWGGEMDVINSLQSLTTLKKCSSNWPHFYSKWVATKHFYMLKIKFLK